MSIDIHFTPERPNNPFEAAHYQLIRELAAIGVPHAISATPRPGEFEAVGDYVRDVTNAADRWYRSIGAEAVSNSTTGMQLDLFEGSFFGAVDGFGLWAIEREAERVSDGTRAASARYCRSRRSFYQMGEAS